MASLPLYLVISVTQHLLKTTIWKCLYFFL